MPNWADENGRYWFALPDGSWLNEIEIPHPPINIRKGCTCAFCKHTKELKKQKTEHIISSKHPKNL